MDRPTKRYDRLTPEQRKHAELHSERKAFNDVTAISEALQRALDGQGNTSTHPDEAHHGNPAALCRKAMRAGRR